MAYMRGKYYIWSDGNNIHFQIPDYTSVGIPNSVVDEYVVMRLAQMNKSQITKAEKRALKKHLGNFGCDGLAKKHGKKTVSERLMVMSIRKIHSNEMKKNK